MMRSCFETASSRSLVDDTSNASGVAFLTSPHRCFAFASVRHASLISCVNFGEISYRR